MSKALRFLDIDVVRHKVAALLVSTVESSEDEEGEDDFEDIALEDDEGEHKARSKSAACSEEEVGPAGRGKANGGIGVLILTLFVGLSTFTCSGHGLPSSLSNVRFLSFLDKRREGEL